MLFQPKRVKDIGKPLFWQLAEHKVNHCICQLLVISFNLEVVEGEILKADRKSGALIGIGKGVSGTDGHCVLCGDEKHII